MRSKTDEIFLMVETLNLRIFCYVAFWLFVSINISDCLQSFNCKRNGIVNKVAGPLFIPKALLKLLTEYANKLSCLHPLE